MGGCVGGLIDFSVSQSPKSFQTLDLDLDLTLDLDLGLSLNNLTPSHLCSDCSQKTMDYMNVK